MAILAALKQLSENKNDAMCVVLLGLMKTKNFNTVLSIFRTLPPHVTEQSKCFQGNCHLNLQNRANIFGVF